MLKRLIGTGLLLLPSLAAAALPPFYQSKREISEILDDSNVARLFSNRPIQEIARTDEGYRITGLGCSLDVKVSYIRQQPGWVGPARFTIEAADSLQCD